MTEFSTPDDWGLIVLAMACLGAGALAIALYFRSRKQNARLVAALNNMSEGLCMFDASTRLILCNERYIEMYGLPAELVKPGVAVARAAGASSPRGRVHGGPRRLRCRYAAADEGRADGAGRPGKARRDLHLRLQPADAGRRMGRHPPGHYRAPPAGSAARQPGRAGATPGEGRCGDRGVPPAYRGDAQDRERQRGRHALDGHHPVCVLA